MNTLLCTIQNTVTISTSPPSPALTPRTRYISWLSDRCFTLKHVDAIYVSISPLALKCSYRRPGLSPLRLQLLQPTFRCHFHYLETACSQIACFAPQMAKGTRNSDRHKLPVHLPTAIYEIAFVVAGNSVDRTVRRRAGVLLLVRVDPLTSPAG